MSNKVHAALRAPVEWTISRIKQWRIFRHARHQSEQTHVSGCRDPHPHDLQVKKAPGFTQPDNTLEGHRNTPGAGEFYFTSTQSPTALAVPVVVEPAKEKRQQPSTEAVIVVSKAPLLLEVTVLTVV